MILESLQGYDWMWQDHYRGGTWCCEGCGYEEDDDVAGDNWPVDRNGNQLYCDQCFDNMEEQEKEVRYGL